MHASSANASSYGQGAQADVGPGSDDEPSSGSIVAAMVYGDAHAVGESAMILSTGDALGRYRIRRPIGGGGFAHTYLASDAILDRNVAIKVAQPDFLPVLLNEARVLAQLEHPWILDILDVGSEGDGPKYTVFEYLSGRSLRDLLREAGGGLPPSRVIASLAAAAEALDYVHRRGYLHRNVKSAVVLHDASGQAHLAGFEVAVQQATQEPGTIAGTPEYMAPENFAATPHRIGPQGDTWGLGVTLYEGLTGQRPFQGALPDVVRLITRTDPAPPSSVNPLVPRDLERICLRCLEKDPSRRYDTAADIAADLRAVQRSIPPPLPRRVFVSHATLDREFVEREIVTRLESDGVRTWYSKVDVQSASEWERTILRGLESCQWFLVVMSPRSAASEWVKDELHWAIDKRPGRIVPVLMEDCDLRAFHIRMARLQYLDFRTPSEEVRGRLTTLFES
jgi:serine/threonine protein kinase